MSWGVFRERPFTPVYRRARRLSSAAAAVKTASGTANITAVTATGAATASGVSITSVDTDNIWLDGDTGLVIVGSGFI